MRLVLFCLAVGLLLHLSPTAKAENSEKLSPRARLDALFEQFERGQKEIETLTARFEQRQEGPLLLEPEIATGRFYYQAPDRMSWEYEEPERTHISLQGTEILTWHRDEGYAERVNGGSQAKRLWRTLGAIYLGTPEALADLRRYFHLHATFPEAPKPYRLELEPRDSTIARRVKSIVVWLDQALLLPVALRQVAPDDSVTEFRFSDLQTNSTIADEQFSPVLPDDVEITELGGR